ncbi:hypothetical protein CANINC_000028 [Pichia inconspicua]|uniref:Major facilitator superfamily (MFS) profile domain-containing protein n=1 Tax=Pichia inconspicua TaxID=52247 RepID=A0A4T0X7H7_9ASCO|nr:hypothetical protein CANINC_000028 [[Candida] inconspicua]
MEINLTTETKTDLISNEDPISSETGVTMRAYELSEFPEGGFEAWMAVCAASTILAMSFGMYNTYGIYQSYYEEKYSATPSNIIGLIGAVQAALTYFTSLPSTIIMEYMGVQLIIALGGSLACTSFIILSFTNAIWQIFLVQGVLFGLGSGLMYIHATGVVMQYFNIKKAFAIGLIMSGASLAGVYWPIGIRNMINKLGFPWANRIVGFIFVPMTIFSYAYAKPRFATTPREVSRSVAKLNIKVLGVKNFWILNFSWLAFMLSLFPGLFYIDLFCVRANVSFALQQYSVAIINGCAIVFRIVPGFYADKIGRINMMIPSLFLSGIFPLVLWIPARGTAMTTAFIICWAAATGPPVALFPAVVGQLFQDTGDLYSYLTFFYLLASVSSLIGPVIAGTFIPRGTVNNTEGFDKLAIFCGILCLISGFFMLILRWRLTKVMVYIV